MVARLPGRERNPHRHTPRGVDPDADRLSTQRNATPFDRTNRGAGGGAAPTGANGKVPHPVCARGEEGPQWWEV